MKKTLLFVLTLSATMVFQACHKPQQVIGVTTEAIAIDASLDSIQDTTYLAQLAPIQADLAREMDVQIGYAPEDLYVAGPECPMLNWASDALWEAAKKLYDGQVDIAIVNMGGMRCAWLKGPITRRSVFELMPFDNRLVVLTLKGSDIIDLCQSFAQYGGQGVAGMRVKIVDGQLADVQVGGKAINPEALYHVATSDYLSGGADHMDALTRYSELWDSDALIRDLYLKIVSEQDTVRSAVDGRMTMYP